MNYYNYWGKADKSYNYHLLVYHSLDVASVGEVLFTKNQNLLTHFSKLTNIESELFKKLFLFFLAIHDLGKFSDAFQGQIKEIYCKFYPNQTPKVYNIRHDSLGYVIWENKFVINQRGNITGELFNLDYFLLKSDNRKRQIRELLNLFINISNGHHGKPPSLADGVHRILVNNYFTNENISDCLEFLKESYQLFFSNNFISQLQNTDFASVNTNVKNISFWLAGLAVLCDWIGSNSEVFHYEKDCISLSEYWEIALPRAEQAIEIAGILPKKISTLKPSELFTDANNKFSLTPLQKACVELEIQSEPQLIILEDVTGSGKTEAAFILTKKLLDKCGYDGFYIGLPTMATSNGMYHRISLFYKKFYELNSQPSLVLAHGARNLVESFQDTIIAQRLLEDLSYSKDEESATTHCLSWLADSNKKATLADCGVGTIDQALLSILLAKFQSLRLFGLMKKVLILDEVHAYDSYVNELIETLLKAQAKIGASVILLSATLPIELKKKFISTYGNETNNLDLESYPLLTQVSKTKTISIPVDTRPEVQRTVEVKLLHQGKEIFDIISDSIQKNKCVCWIRNTVTDAIHAYESLSNSYDRENLILFHARFTLGDRLDREQKVLQLFGKESNSQTRSKKILIATQVVEQSLDLDFDVMITDLAPIDLIIQRAGRLHRHTRDKDGNRVSSNGREKPILYVYSPQVIDNPPQTWFSNMFKGGAKVYPDHGKLYLSAKILNQKGKIQMPEDARKLIEFVYDKNQTLPQNLETITQQNINQNNIKSAQAQNNILNFNAGYTFVDNVMIWEEKNAPTRLGEETVKVYLAKYENGKLFPWYSSNTHAWFYSEVSVLSYFLKSEKPPLDTNLEKEINSCKEQLPDKGRYSILFPLIQQDGNWIGIALDSNRKEINYIYDTNLGFRKL